MSPIMFLVIGLILIWLVFTGRATDMWKAMTQGNAGSIIPPKPTGGSGA